MISHLLRLTVQGNKHLLSLAQQSLLKGQASRWPLCRPVPVPDDGPYLSQKTYGQTRIGCDSCLAIGFWLALRRATCKKVWHKSYTRPLPIVHGKSGGKAQTQGISEYAIQTLFRAERKFENAINKKEKVKGCKKCKGKRILAGATVGRNLPRKS